MNSIKTIEDLFNLRRSYSDFSVFSAKVKEIVFDGLANDSENIVAVEKKLKDFEKKYCVRWKTVKYHERDFRTKYGVWLTTELDFPKRPCRSTG
jgi:hypothetical protein